ncbi:NAD(P)-dependent alcohol dehydrogenase [Caballeronia sp. SEWSISQ10-4 2]|uniref:zinc-dependent alcohol dehydrogenase family protein n=1 Tax=Caballeronia sp. SEWSISQ10-4 2 TaxID=2937438 RepID=UPI002655BF97|nr:NAD(P)-dependent alcohol dehydrogenase [Caballeronia sp. SEWSISQ10-4 2]MDN7184773.1 NAD(P)-dependent alcohol dehydrogenase [Caballeronia sp. SEWSISQ10-4 2]
MRVVELTGVGVDALRVTDREEGAVAAGLVRLKVKAISLNYRDLFVVKGYMPVQYPLIPLSDAVGEVVEVGAGVNRVKTGDRAIATYYPDWLGGTIAPHKFERDRGGTYDGVATEYLVVSEAELIKVPDFLSDAEAATLPCAGVTAWSAITESSNIKAGDAVLVQGTGGVSLMALQFAMAAGAETFIISSSDAKLERAKALGAHHTINYSHTPGWGKIVSELTGGRGVDLVVDVAGSTLGESIVAVANGGHISQVGILGGVEASLPIYPLMTKSVHIDGIMSGSRDAAEVMMRAIAIGKVKPVVDSVFGFSEIPDALEHLDSRNHFGKIVIAVD